MTPPFSVALTSAYPTPDEGRAALEKSGLPGDKVAPYQGVWLLRAGALEEATEVYLFADDATKAELLAESRILPVGTEPEVKDGPVLTAVKADIAALGDDLHGGARQTYAAMALWLAEVIDKRGAEEGPSNTARLAAELRAYMAALTKAGAQDDDALRDYLRNLRTPVAPSAG